jgi:small-conductance mechanosensitive channel
MPARTGTQEDDVGQAAAMIESTLDWIRDAATTLAGTLVIAAAWVAGGFWIAGIARNLVSDALAKRSMGWNGAVLVSRLTSILIRIVAIMIALSVLGVSGTGLIAVASAFTVAIGLSLQDVLKNFFAGIYLLLERPFKVGDRIVVRDVSGEVQGIDIRTTLIRNVNNELVLIPNATVFTEILRNDTYYGVRRFDLTITSQGRRFREIEERVHGALESVEGVRRPLPEPRIVSSDNEGLKVRMSLMADNSDIIQNRIAEAVIDALPDDAIEVVTT